MHCSYYFTLSIDYKSEHDISTASYTCATKFAITNCDELGLRQIAVILSLVGEFSAYHIDHTAQWQGKIPKGKTTSFPSACAFVQHFHAKMRS
jgi:hypothetical protein